LPSAVSTDAAGNVYTLDIDDPRVRKISSAGSVSSIAGNGQVGFKDGNAVDAEFGKETSGITLDKDGNIYVVDFDNKRIRKITPGGSVRTIAGNGITGLVNGNADQAEFFSPSGIALDKQGNIYVGDDHQVRMISSNGHVSTYAGSATAGFRDGSAAQAMFNSIIDLVIDQDGNLFLTDDIRIREVDTHGNVTTIAGSTTGYADGDGLNAKFSSPAGLTIDKNGNLFVADVNNNRIRKITTH
jgi:sugar lactone lactonase YvrE